MNFLKVFSLFALLTLAALSVSAVSAQTSQLFLDNFNSGLGSWNSASGNGAWNIPTGQGYIEAGAVSGTTSAFLTRNSVTTTGFQSIILTYDRKLSGGFGNDNSFNISISTDNINFVQVFTISGSNVPIESFPNTQTQNLPSSANNIANLYIRFECYTDALAESCQIDNVKLEGTPISTAFSITAQGTQPFTVIQNASLTISNGATSALSGTITEIGSTLFGVTFSPNTFNLATGASTTVQASLSNLQNLKFGTNTVNVQASAGTQTATTSFQVRKTFCSAVPIASNLTIKSIDISNDGEGDENEWELLDEFDIEVEIENNNQDDDIDAIVEIGLFDSEGRNLADDLDFLSDSDSDNEEIEININEDDSETVNFKFRVPADFDTGNYRLAFKTYDDDAGESRSCRDSSNDLDEGFFESVDVKEASDEGRFVVVDEFNIDSQVVCGATLSGQFTIFNIGEEDQDRVNVIIKNNELNINEEVEFTSDLDQGDEETLSFSVRIPSTASNGIKRLEFITEYDYKNGVYREDSEEAFVFPIEIIGCSQNLGGSGSVSGLTNTNIEADLSSDAVAGQELVITSTITNTGTTSKTYTIDARGYSQWAELTDISDESFTLDAGESTEIVFKFMVNEDSSGTQAFDIQLSSEGKVQVQEVEVELAESSNGFSFDLKGSSTLWIIGIVNVVLILLIIVVAIRLSRK